MPLAHCNLINALDYSTVYIGPCRSLLEGIRDSRYRFSIVSADPFSVHQPLQSVDAGGRAAKELLPSSQTHSVCFEHLEEPPCTEPHAGCRAGN